MTKARKLSDIREERAAKGRRDLTVVTFVFFVLILAGFGGCTALVNHVNNSPEAIAKRQKAERKSACLDRLRSQLKDPDSLRVISYNGTYVEYTATNSFGGRIRNTHRC